MRYPGSKKRLSKVIAALVEPYLADRNVYIEPFLGGANSFAAVAPLADYSIAVEANLDLALMWQAVQNGWEPPTDVSEELYQSMKTAPPSPLRGFVGSGCSFGGKWFGGYARGGFNADGTPRNHQAESARAVIGKRGKIKNSVISFGSYENIPVTANSVVYCDPPYAGTLNYSGADLGFKSEEFWYRAEMWARCGAVVLVSEYVAPAGWEEIYSQEQLQSVSKADTRATATEKIFMLAR